MKKPEHNRTIVLGLDSLDLKLVEMWASQGLLPFFSSLFEACPLVRLAALSRVLQGSIWPSILTGLSPGHHGQYSFSQLIRGTYNLEGRRADDVAGERFYVHLGNHGVRCAVVDVPTDLLHPQFPGIQVVDWGAEFRYSTFRTHPPELKEEIETRFGRHLFTDYGTTEDSLEAHRKLRDDLEQAIEVKSALTRQILARDDLDLILVVYGEPHKAGHFFWKYLDPTYPGHVPVPDMQAAMLKQYQLIDRELASLAAMLKPQDNLLVFTDHGMQANHRGEHFMEILLERLGLCQTARRARLDGGIVDSSPLAVMHRKVRGQLHRMLKSLAPKAVTDSLRKKFGAASQVDWTQTKAFALPTDRNSYIRLNVRNREPQGIVEPGPEYEALLDFIENGFRALRNGETGKPAVEEVFRVQQLYPGPRSSELPDLAILWSSEGPINVLESGQVGRLEMRYSEQRSGNHRPEGFLFARGPAFRQGKIELRGDILQIAPTLLALHSVPCPDTYGAEPIHDLISPSAST